MDPPQKSQATLFQVYLRLRPPPSPNQLYPTLTTPERCLSVEEASGDELPTHITLNPPNDNRRRAVEKFAFTKVFEENATQLDVFQGTGVLPLVEGVLGSQGGEGRDGLLATLGVTGSGKVRFFSISSIPRQMLTVSRAIQSLDLAIRADSPSSHSTSFSAQSQQTSSIQVPRLPSMLQSPPQTPPKHKLCLSKRSSTQCTATRLPHGQIRALQRL